MALWQWSTTAANNATADPSINWQEGQAPSTVNDSARAMMAAVATWFQSPEWLNLGDTPTYVSATQFTVSTNRTAVYTVGRRVRAFVTAGTVYGTITASSYTSLTTVTVSWDSGSLDGGLSEVDAGILNPSNSSLSVLPALTVKDQTTSGTGPLIIDGSGNTTYGAGIKLLGNGATTPAKFIHVQNGNLYFTNNAYTLAMVAITDAGNMTVAGNITANSDERLKTDWQPMPNDFIERLASVKSGTYERIDLEDGIRHAGVGAQSLRAVLPEAVLEGAQGMLSVAYGQAALVAAIELSQEVLRLRDELREVRHLAGV